MTSATDRLGTVLRERDRLGLRFVRHLRHSPDRVWRALSDRDQLSHWFPTDIIGDHVEGAELRMPFWSEHVEEYGLQEVAVTHGRLRVWDPPRVLELSWEHELLRYELEADGDHTVLTLRPCRPSTARTCDGRTAAGAEHRDGRAVGGWRGVP